ncbi:hypothetical protein SBA2_230018 [Acidobacteriia bacterium SbA2]|nr:hypothetical protein SBA2_230018 [Acidobacteriia bacterium SbA2]
MPSSAALGSTQIVVPSYRAGDYNRVHVAPSTLSGIGPLVLYYLPAITQPTHSVGFRIRHLGRGD